MRRPAWLKVARSALCIGSTDGRTSPITLADVALWQKRRAPAGTGDTAQVCALQVCFSPPERDCIVSTVALFGLATVTTPPAKVHIAELEGTGNAGQTAMLYYCKSFSRPDCIYIYDFCSMCSVNGT